MEKLYCVAMLTHDLLTTSASPEPSHYRLAMEKESANHLANSYTSSTSPLQLPAIQKRLTQQHTHTLSLNLQTADLHMRHDVYTVQNKFTSASSYDISMHLTHIIITLPRTPYSVINT